MTGFNSNDEWLSALQGEKQSLALEMLRHKLIQGLHYSLIQRYHVTEVDVEDFVQDALLKILASLDSFRGESQFTTWAQKIAIRTALTELRRRRWKDVSLQDLTGEGTEDAYTPAFLAARQPSPEKVAMQQSFLRLLDRMIEEDLTPRQRTAIKAVMFGEMPLEEVARRMGTNRNALYKLIHDARLRLKAQLTEQGVTLEEVMSAFSNEP
ncbi:MAG: RNA polymerase sigma factor [Anaerolineae bacterium]|nr:RNA polymerase sigma factor [Anaerolineae bacterium]